MYTHRLATQQPSITNEALKWFAPLPVSLENHSAGDSVGCVPRKVGICANSGIALLKIGIPKMNADPGIAHVASSIQELRCAQSWNVPHSWNFYIIPIVVRYIQTTVAVI